MASQMDEAADWRLALVYTKMWSATAQLAASSCSPSEAHGGFTVLDFSVVVYFTTDLPAPRLEIREKKLVAPSWPVAHWSSM